MNTKNEKIILDTIPLHGDQLFEERCRNTQWTFQNRECSYDRLQGIQTEFADWHAKLNLYMVRRHSLTRGTTGTSLKNEEYVL